MPHDSFTIRQATAGDAPAVAALFLAARQRNLPWLPVVHDDDDVRGWIANVLVPSGAVWVATGVDDAPLGFAALTPGWLDHLYVHPDHQGRGVGSRLLAFAVEREPGALQLWTFQDNAPARRFYEGRGFVPVEFTDGAENEERWPDVRYVREPGQPG